MPVSFFKTTAALCFLAQILLASLSRADTFNSASLAAPFEATSSSARDAGLAGSLYYSDGDSAEMLQNPAALSSMKFSQVGLHHNTWFADVVQEVVTFGLPLGDSRAFGMTVNYVNYGRFQGRDETGRTTTSLGASDLGIGMGYSQRLIGPVFAGGILRSMEQTLADQSYTTYAGDFGLSARLNRPISLSFSYLNFGSAISGSQLAARLRLGADWKVIESSDASLHLGAGYILVLQGEAEINAGLEAMIGQLFSVRAGASFPTQSTEVEGLRNVTFGAGFYPGAVRFDYAYLPYGDLGSVQRVSLSYSFLAPTQPTPTPIPVPTRTVTATPSLPPPPLPPLQTPSPTPTATPTPKPAARAADLEFVIQVSGKKLDQARESVKAGKLVEAVKLYSDAVQSSPEDFVAWREMGDLYRKLDKKDFALRCYEEVLRLRPSDQEFRKWLDTYR
jgi:tetratricopeptide (TPR) repeat protein